MSAVPAPETGPDAGAVWHYGDPLGEQRAAATAAVAVDRSHRATLQLTGGERKGWLHTISSQHVSELPDGAVAENLSLDGQGRVEDHWLQTQLDGVTVLDTEGWRGQPLLDFLRKNPGKVNYGSAGNGTSHHMAGELFKQQSKTSITHIPYRGAGPALQDLIAGTVDMAFDGLGSSAGHIKGGRIKALMVAGNKRNPAIPDVPSAAEVGLPAYDVHTWYGLWAPKGTPADTVARG